MGGGLGAMLLQSQQGWAPTSPLLLACADGPRDRTEFAPVPLSGSPPGSPGAGRAHVGPAPCPKTLCCHLNGPEPVQEGVHSPEDEGAGEVPDLRLLLEAERGRQRAELARTGPGGPTLSPAPTRKHMGVVSEQ